MIKDKLKIHPSLNYAADLKQICEPLQLLNINYFAHVQVDKQGQFSALGLQPEFVKLYLQKEYYRYDIHMAQLPQRESYIIWDNVERVKESKELYDDFMDFNIGHTFTICQQHEEMNDYFHFSTKLGNYHMNQQNLLQLDRLKQFINYFRDKTYQDKALKAAYQIKFAIPTKASGYFTAQENLELTNAFHHAFTSKRTFIDHHTYLTQQEMQCLYYLSLGKKTSDIAKLLSITPRTVKAHIKNIKLKLNCDNQFQMGLMYARIKA
jgi:DNA-binding CsgD family transcriptional regulator